MRISILSFMLLLCTLASAQNHNLKIQIEGIKSEKGKILYSLFSSKSGFPGDSQQAIKKGIVNIEKNHANIEIDLPSGEYAIILFHDEDDNNELETNFIGFPKEGVGNSNNHRGIPSFKKSVFKLTEDRKIVINIWYS